MLATVCLGLTLFVTQAGRVAVTLPDTPQGRHVDAFIKAFNTGDEKTFIQAEAEHMTKTILEKRPATERGQMFKRMQGDFGTFKLQKVVTSTADEIQVIFPTKEGDDAVFTFNFEKEAPFKIAGIGVDIKGGAQ
jgi:hypothetical protein